MKKIFTLLLILPVMVFAQELRTGKVFEAVNAVKASSGEFQSFQLFQQQTRGATANYSEGVNDGIVVSLDQNRINEIRNQSPQLMRLTIPFDLNNGTVDLDLMKVDVFSPTFKAVSNTGANITNTVDMGIHYRGVVANNPQSLVSISVFENQVIGFVAIGEGSFSIGRLADSETDHIIYRDSDLKMAQDFTCATEDDGVGYTAEELNYTGQRDPGDIIDIYVESGQSVYNSFGGNISDAVAFLTGVFAQCYALYANDGIAARTSSMFVWTDPDPYTSGNSSTQLNTFRARTGFYDGDLGHLVEVQNIGGIASGFAGICAPNSDNGLCFSGFAGTNFNNVPIYSFNVFIIAHEMGHLMGSRHTHACVWNGNNTAIDSCSGFTEGSCPLPGDPPGGGTIMSYCHVSSVGVNFNLGFGPQPQAVILNNIEAVGNCLNPDGLTPPTAVCTNYTAVLDSSGNATITPADLDGGSYDDVAITDFAIDITSVDCDDIGVVIVTLTVTDGDGLTNTCETRVNVVDNEDPSVTDCPVDFTETVAAGGSFSLPDYTGTVTASDNCTFTLSQDPAPGTDLTVGVYTITITGEDSDGNEGSCSFELTVDETLSFDDASLGANIAFYPNPSDGIVVLANPQNFELETLTIYDLSGRLVKSIDLEDMGTQQTIDISGLANSSYMVIIEGANERTTKQLIKR